MMMMTTRKRNQRRKRNTKKESKAKVKAMMIHIKRKRCLTSVILFTATACESDENSLKKKKSFKLLRYSKSGKSDICYFVISIE